jgi:hypothetical protein
MKINKRNSKGQIIKGNNLIHGLSKDPVFDCWVAMKARCLNVQHPNYHQYGGRGIKVCDRWLNSFENFLNDVGIKPTKKHTLDRINNDGNYEPGNCRWVTIQQQQVNRRNNTDSPGIRWEKDRGRWRADITFNGVRHFLGRFQIKAMAQFVRREAELKYWGCM